MSVVRRRLLSAGAIALAATLAAALAWALTPLGPGDSALTALSGSDAASVARTSWGWRFAPRDGSATTGLVIYPGGRVDARSYAPVALKIAERGHVVAIVEVPLSLAVFAPKAADGPLGTEQAVQRWVVGGHSLGGVMAARFARANPQRVAGVLLLASYPDPEGDLSGTTLDVTSITGSADGVLNRARWEQAKSRLPARTRHVSIQGGNHAQFGDYGEQDGDNPASVSAERQWERIADEASELVNRTTRPVEAD